MLVKKLTIDKHIFTILLNIRIADNHGVWFQKPSSIFICINHSRQLKAMVCGR